MAASTTPSLGLLYEYQREAIMASARIKVLKWCRQAGKDHTAAFMGAIGALETKQPWYIVSLTERQSVATFDKVKQHLRAFGILLKGLKFIDEEVSWIDARGALCRATAKKVLLPGGGSVTALPGSNPDAIAGLTGNVIFTELALFPNNGIDHWRVVAPLITRGFRIIGISTPRGHDTKFAQLCRNDPGSYFVSVVDIHRAVADGMPLKDHNEKRITIAAWEKEYADDVGWQREYLVKESDNLDALISWNYLELAKADYEATRLTITSKEDYNPDFDNVFQTLTGQNGASGSQRGAYFFGWDLARYKHFSSVWINQLVGDVFYLRLLVNMQGMDFPYMNKVAVQAMDICARGAADATGMGMETCERLGQTYGSRFDAVNFATSKGEIGSKLMTTFQDVRQRLPAKGFDDVYRDLHGIQKEERGNRTILHETKNAIEPRSHCDMAWAAGLCLFSASGAATGPVEAILGPELNFARDGAW